MKFFVFSEVTNWYRFGASVEKKSYFVFEKEDEMKFKKHGVTVQDLKEKRYCFSNNRKIFSSVREFATVEKIGWESKLTKEEKERVDFFASFPTGWKNKDGQMGFKILR